MGTVLVRILASALLAVWLSAVADARAEQAPAATTAPTSSARDLAGRGPIHVTSRDLEVHRREGYAVFSNNVVVTQGNWKLLAEKVTVYSGETDTDVQKFVAERNVRFFQDNRRGTASRATYTKLNDTLVMEGNPVLLDGNNRLAGEKIFYEVGRDVMRVQKATAVVVPKKADDASPPAGGAKP